MSMRAAIERLGRGTVTRRGLVPLAAVSACVLTLGLAPGCTKEEPPDGMGGMGGMGGASGNPTGGWTKIELEGAVCADGSQYKFFVKPAAESAGLVVTMEPGGACWDYATCGGGGGETRAANLDGLEDNHMVAMPPPLGPDPDAIPWGLMFPHMGVSQSDVPTVDYDQVYLPYCTGDAFMGDIQVRYAAPIGDDGIQIQHRGAANMELVKGWLAEAFPSPEHLLVVGSSAGGLGATFHYAGLRDAVSPGRSGFINDSGPIFPPGGPQDLARQQFMQRWMAYDLLDDLSERLGAQSEQWLRDDPGHITAVLSAAFPDDRFLVTYFLSDLDNSNFAYGETLDDLSQEALTELWLEDTELLVDVIEATDNWGYYLPGFRADNCSHCVAILPVNELSDVPYLLSAADGSADGYLRTDLGDVDFGAALASVLADDGELIRERAGDPMTAFTDAEVAECLDTAE